MGMTYSEQLRHPEWQKRRLLALERAEWACQRCYDSESTLHVHHKRYVKGRMAWEYEDFELEVVCEHCHKEEHDGPDLLSDAITRLPHDFRDSAAAILVGWGTFSNLKSMHEVVQELDPVGFVAGQLASDVTDLLDWGSGVQLRNALWDLLKRDELTRCGFRWRVPDGKRLRLCLEDEEAVVDAQ